MTSPSLVSLAVLTASVAALAAIAIAAQPDSSFPDAKRLEAMSARFAPVEIGADLSALPATERRALAKLVEAGHIMDALF